MENLNIESVVFNASGPRCTSLEELEKIDKFIRGNIIASFGPVKEVKKALVVELAFDSIHKSNRHKSGLALRFPRVNKIRWDKPVEEVLGLIQIKVDFKIAD